MNKNNVNTLNGFPIPSLGNQGSVVAEQKNIWCMELLGYSTYEGVAFSNDQIKALMRWIPVKGEAEEENPYTRAGNLRNLMRTTQMHGLRLMAFLAGRGLLEKNRDPVLSLADMITEFLEEEVIDISEAQQE